MAQQSTASSIPPRFSVFGLKIPARLSTASIVSLVFHGTVIALVGSGLTSEGRATLETLPMRVAVIMDDAPLPDSLSHVLEDLDLGEDLTNEEQAKAENLPILEPAPLPEDFDPLFLPDSSEFEDLPDGLEAFVQTAPVASNLNADVTEEMLSTNAAGASNDQSPTPAEIEAAITDEPAPALVAEPEVSEAEAEDEEQAQASEGDASADEEPINYPLIPKPRPRAAPTYRDIDAEERAAEAQAQAAQLAAETTADEGDSETDASTGAGDSSSGGSSTDRTDAEQAATRYAQTCFDLDVTLNPFVRFSNAWQVAFIVGFDAEGTPISAVEGKIAYPSGATKAMVEAFVSNIRETIYTCDGFKNPEGIEGVPFEVEIVYQPGA